jgi:hypothetical protein
MRMATSWSALISQHEASISDLRETASQISARLWLEPVKEDGWTPAQILRHINQVYEVMLKQISMFNEGKENQAVKLRTGWFTRTLLRWTIFRSIMNKRTIPGGAKSPREFRPGEVTADAATLTDQLQDLAQQLTQQLEPLKDNAHFSVNHHLFGKLNAREAFRFITIHNEHHLKQLQSVLNETE